MYGPGSGFGWGFHALVLFGIVVLWLLVIAGILFALYFVIRTAVTRGILRADALRAAPSHGAHPHGAVGHHPAPPRPENPGTTPSPQPPAGTASGATSADDRRDDPRPPDVAA